MHAFCAFLGPMSMKKKSQNEIDSLELRFMEDIDLMCYYYFIFLVEIFYFY